MIRRRGKMKTNRMWLYLLLIGVSGLFPLTSRVHAGNCSVSTTSIDFGNYDVFSSAPTTGTGSITISCNSGTDVRIAIGASSNSGGFFPRTMDHSLLSDTLDYNIYKDLDMHQVWGDGTHGTATAYFTKVKKNLPPITVYGKIEPLQNVSTGDYGEHLFVTIMF
jgi:spore coat protein U-like protein